MLQALYAAHEDGNPDKARAFAETTRKARPEHPEPEETPAIEDQAVGFNSYLTDPVHAQRLTERLNTEAGRLAISRAGLTDYEAVMAILREAADWLSARGNPQWKHWHMEVGERMLRDRLKHHEVYLARRDAVPVGTVTIQWSDPEQWGERGLDNSAGYIHGIAITRSVGGARVGERLLEWAVETIAARGRRLARLDATASNASLCRYYERHGFRPLETATLFGGIYTTRLFERELRPW